MDRGFFLSVNSPAVKVLFHSTDWALYSLSRLDWGFLLFSERSSIGGVIPFARLFTHRKLDWGFLSFSERARMGGFVKTRLFAHCLMVLLVAAVSYREHFNLEWNFSCFIGLPMNGCCALISTSDSFSHCRHLWKFENLVQISNSTAPLDQVLLR